MLNKKFIAKEWLLLLFSFLFGHFIFAIFVLIIDILVFHSGENLKSIYSILLEDPKMFLIATLCSYAFIQIIYGTVWSVKQFIKK